MTLNKKITFILMAAAILLISFSQTSYSQDRKVKSLTVIEEKHEDNSVNTYKESEIKYDAKGNVIEQIEYKEGKVETHFSYEYDSENNKIKEIEYDKKGAIDKISEYKYQNGLRIEKVVYDSQKKLKTKKTYRYTFY